jgi:phenylalanyl-tRNA synthetase beta chain
MGGLDSEVSENTTTILLEEAHFDPVCVRTTSRRLNLPSDAAFRFERIVDIDAVDWASKRTAQLIIQAAGGRTARGVVDVYPGKTAAKTVIMRLSRLNKLLGIDVKVEKAAEILSALNFGPSVDGDLITCTVPSWRSDVYREADLIEEVARVHGYNKIPTERKIKIEVVPVDSRHKIAESAKTYLNACGFYETINVTFIDKSIAALFCEDDAEHLAVRDESRKSANLLRRTLIGSLLGVLKTNANAKNLPCRIFEIADTFVPAGGKSGELPVERTKLALVYDGDFRELRGAIEGLVHHLSRDVRIDIVPADLTWAQNGAQVIVDSKEIGTAGIISDALKQEFDFKEFSPCAAELDFELLLSMVQGDTGIKTIPRFPAIQRDLSLIVDEQIPWADIINAIEARAPQELEDVRFVGIYRGKSIAQDKKSVTLSLRFRDEDGTLTHETVDRFEADIVTSITESTGAELRTA